MIESDKIWIDGNLIDYDEAKVHVLTHGLHYGTGVFEGIRSYKTAEGITIFRLDDHIRRLFNSGKAYFMKFEYTFDELKRATVKVVKANNWMNAISESLRFMVTVNWGLTLYPIRYL